MKLHQGTIQYGAILLRGTSGCLAWGTKVVKQLWLVGTLQ